METHALLNALDSEALGLSSTVVEERRRTFGPNRLQREAVRTAFATLLVG